MANGDTFGRARQRIKQTKRSLRRERESGFKAVSNLNQALFKQLRGDIEGRAGHFTLANERILGRMQTLQGELASQRGQVTRREAGAGPSTLSGVSQQAFGPARARAAGAARVGEGFGLRAHEQTRTTGGLFDLARQGAREAEAGSEFALARALEARTREDVALTAQMEQQLDLAEIQHQQRLQEMQLQQEFWREQFSAQEQALRERMTLQDANDPSRWQGVSQVTTFTQQIAPALRELMAAHQQGPEALGAMFGLEPGNDEYDQVTQAPLTQLAQRLVAQQLGDPELAAHPGARAITANLMQFWAQRRVIDPNQPLDVNAMARATLDAVKASYGPSFNLSPQEEQQMIKMLAASTASNYFGGALSAEQGIGGPVEQSMAQQLATRGFALGTGAQAFRAVQRARGVTGRAALSRTRLPAGIQSELSKTLPIREGIREVLGGAPRGTGLRRLVSPKALGKLGLKLGKGGIIGAVGGAVMGTFFENVKKQAFSPSPKTADPRKRGLVIFTPPGGLFGG